MIGVRLPEEAWEDVEEGVEGLLEEWLVEEGATVAAGQPLANATVVKTSHEVTAPAAGTVASIAVAAGVRVEMDACLALEDELRADLGPELRLSPTHMLLRAVALTLAEHPRLNGVVGEDGADLASEVALGLAVNLSEGIVVPVLRDVASRPLAEIVSESQRLAEAARAGELGNAELSGGTFTVSNLGATGIDWFTPILNSPQIAILGVGAIAERPVVVAGEVRAAPTMDLTLVYDHRAVDGQPASAMLAALRDRLQRADLGLDG